MSLLSRIAAVTGAPEPQPAAASFDRVTLESPSGEVREMTQREFAALPLDKRVRAILDKKLRFFRGDREVSVREALHRY